MRSRADRILAVVAVAALIAGACAPAPAPVAGEGPLVVARAPWSAAPVVWPLPTGFAAAWVGSDEAGVHQDARVFTRDEMMQAVTLPLPPVHPYDQRGAPGGENLHLLWLDDSDAGDNRLFAALLSPSLAVLRGPTPVSDQTARRYAIAPAGDGGLWIAWSGGLLAEPVLYLQRLDARGRPRQPVRAAVDADWPALAARDDGTLDLFWVDRREQQLTHARLVGGELLPPTVLAPVPGLVPGDRVQAVHAALDDANAYFVWNLTRVAGDDQTWVASGPLDADAWEAPYPLALPASEAAGGEPVALEWGVPLPGQHEPLPLAVQAGSRLSLFTLSDGVIDLIAPLADLERDLIGPPALAAAGNAQGYAAWAEPSGAGSADLQVVSLPAALP